jgi:hypothetical protein
VSTPLFAPGFHDIHFDDLDRYFVEPFNDGKEHRAHLTGKLRAFLNEVSAIGMPYEVWLDGSYATDKPLPGDVDLVVLFAENHLDGANQEQIEDLLYLFSDTYHEEIKIRFHCDVYITTKENVEKRAYWRGFFAFDRDEKPKGIPRLVIEEAA